MAHLSPAFEKLILTELRLAAFIPDEEGAPLTDEKIAQAVTVNEELKNLGFVLAPGDLMMLAKSPSLTGFAAHFRELLPDVSALPMYPDFPVQVMEMDEAEFRLHQQIHYFSTYDIEWLFGTQVSRGWLPDVQSTEKTESDDTLLKVKVLELVPESKAAITALPEWGRSRLLLTYLAMGSEVETRAIIQAAWEAGKLVALPRVIGPHQMTWYQVDDLDGLEKSKFGVLEPPAQRRAEVNPKDAGTHALAIVPGLAFDRRGYRLGYGGGFYDSFLAAFAGTSVGICRESTLVDKLTVVEKYDVPVDVVITESETLYVRGR